MGDILNKEKLMDDVFAHCSGFYHKISKQLDDEIGTWAFNGDVAQRFTEIAEREIPDYQRVIDKTAQVINKYGLDNPK